MKNDIETYIVNIPFSLLSFPPVVPHIKTGKFEIDNLKLELKKNNKGYNLLISNFKDEQELLDFIEKFEFFIKYYTLGREYCAIDYDRNKIWSKGINIELVEMQVEETLDRFEEELEEILNNTYKLSDELELALDIFSKYSQYNKKSQFLDLITILEILKPEYNVSIELKETINIIKNKMKKIRDEFERDSEEYEEFNRFFTDMGYWKTKSINKSLQLLANNYQDEFKEFENIDVMIKEAYVIRSNIVHNGIIDEEFDEYYNFLRRFVGKLLKILIDEKKIK